MNEYKYASGKRYPLGIGEEKERDAMWLEDRGLDRARQKVYDFNGELTDTFYGYDRDVPKVDGVGRPTFVVYPDYVNVEVVPVGRGHQSEDAIREAWRSFVLFCDRKEREDGGPDCGNMTMNYMMDGLADLGKLGLSTAMAYAASDNKLYKSAVPMLLDMGADPNAVVFLSSVGYTTPFLRAVDCVTSPYNRYYNEDDPPGGDGTVYSRAASCGSVVDIMLEAGADPFKAILCPDLINLYHNIKASSTYRYTCKMVSILDCLCRMACAGNSTMVRATDMHSSRSLYALSSLIDRIAGRDKRFLEFLHCGAFSGGLAIDRTPRYHPGELATRMFAGSDALMTAYASLIGLVPRTADIYGPGCYAKVPGPYNTEGSDDNPTAFSDKARALFNSGLPFEWDGRWGMDISASHGMGSNCPSRACYLGDDGDAGVWCLGSSVKWLSGRSYSSSQWVDGNLLDVVVAFGANVDGCRVDGNSTVNTKDETFLCEAMRRNDWEATSNHGRQTALGTAYALLDMGANPNVQSEEHGTPIMSLARAFANRWSTCDTRTAMLESLRELIGYGADANAVDKGGRDALRILVEESIDSLWGDSFSEKGRAQQLIEFAQVLIEAGLDLNRTFNAMGSSGKVKHGVPHEYGMDHPLSHFIAAARKRLNEIDEEIRKERERLEAEASKVSEAQQESQAQP